MTAAPAASSHMAASDNAPNAVGSFTFVLHSHLPYVLSHGTWPHGTDWLCEAAAETYIPLLNVFNRLVDEGITPRVTIGLTPILTEMLADLSFAAELQDYLQTKINVAHNNARELAAQGLDQYRDIALFWENWYTNIARDFEHKYNRDLVGAFRKLQDDGHLEIITSAATHGYLPLLGTDEAVQAQVRIGVDAYKKHYGRPPRGIWLPECAYRPRYEWKPPQDTTEADEPPVLRKGVDEFLSENNIEYFVVDAHLLKGGKALGVYAERFEGLRAIFQNFADQYQPLAENEERTPHEVYLVASAPDKAPVACFARHERTSMQVWSAEHGYPGDGYYLDFHKKHFPGGLRLWRVVSTQADLAQKQPYEPGRIAEISEAQANHFVQLVKDGLRAHRDLTGQPGIVCCPYDAELFGHWWFEGPDWLYRALKKLWQDPEIDLTTGGRYLDQNPPTKVISLPEGSWGEGGFHYIWLNPDNVWTWREIYACEKEMTRLARQYGETTNPKLREIVEQCGRELLLMESSDWQFLISTVAARDYAELRCAGHINVFQMLAAMGDRIGAGEVMSEGDRVFLQAAQQRDSCFQDVPLKLWAQVEHPA
ncbi:MAG TPA: 1,4-alpha-glucan branching protein domain-containing protein [Abditibacteriaceae bacterium]|nr:1,4-alpha-glucan branching protein domain-containing protein [Abditibacteriaceae bacterium]